MEKLFSKFNKIDEELKEHFIMQFMGVIFMFVLSLTSLFATKSFVVFFLFLIVLLLYIALIAYKLYLCYEDKIVFIEGNVDSVYLKKNIKEKFEFENPHINIIQDTASSVYVKIYTSQAKKFKEGNFVKAYINPKHLKRINEDTYSCYSFFYIHLKRNKK